MTTEIRKPDSEEFYFRRWKRESFKSFDQGKSVHLRKVKYRYDCKLRWSSPFWNLDLWIRTQYPGKEIFVLYRPYVNEWYNFEDIPLYNCNIRAYNGSFS